MKLHLVAFLVACLCITGALSEHAHKERYRRQAPHQLRQHQQQINYRPFSQAPNQIKQILQSQLARDPLVHIPAQPPPQLAPAQRAEPQYQTQAQISSYRPQVQIGNPPQQPTYKNVPVGPAQYRGAPAAAQRYTGGAAQRYTGGAVQPNYYQPQQPAQPQYSKNLPPQLQQLLQIQAQLPTAGQGKVIQPPQQRLY